MGIVLEYTYIARYKIEKWVFIKKNKLRTGYGTDIIKTIWPTDLHVHDTTSSYQIDLKSLTQRGIKGPQNLQHLCIYHQEYICRLSQDLQAIEVISGFGRPRINLWTRPWSLGQ